MTIDTAWSDYVHITATMFGSHFDVTCDVVSLNVNVNVSEIGTMSLTLNNRDGKYSYLVAASTPIQILDGIVLSVTAVHSSTTHPLGTFYIQKAYETFHPDGRAHVHLEGVDAWKSYSEMDLPAMHQPMEREGKRIRFLFHNRVGWPLTAIHVEDTDGSELLAGPVDGSLAQILVQIGESTGAAYFVDRFAKLNYSRPPKLVDPDGPVRVVYLRIYADPDGVPTTGLDPDDFYVCATDLAVVKDGTKVVNDVTLSNVAGESKHDYDQISQTKYGKRSLVRTDMMSTFAVLNSYARRIVDVSKEPGPVPSRVGFRVASDAEAEAFVNLNVEKDVGTIGSPWRGHLSPVAVYYRHGADWEADSPMLFHAGGFQVVADETRLDIALYPHVFDSANPSKGVRADTLAASWVSPVAHVTDATLGADWHQHPTFAHAAYWLDEEGVVHIQGLVTPATGTTVKAGVLFTLPPDMHPFDEKAHMFMAPDNSSPPILRRVDVHPDGHVELKTAGEGSFVALDGISFLARR